MSVFHLFWSNELLGDLHIYF